MQNLKRNWLVNSKLTWGIWWILTRALESLKDFHFKGLLFSKVYIVWLKMNRGVIFHETEEGYKICRGIDSSFQNWHKEFNKIWPKHSKVSKHFILLGSFWAKYILFELKMNRGVIFHENEEDTKFVEESTRRFKICIRNLTKFDPSTQKSQKFSF